MAAKKKPSTESTPTPAASAEPAAAPKVVRKTASPGAPTKVKGTTAEAAEALALTQKYIGKFTKGAQKPLAVNNAPLPCVSSGSLALDNMIGGTLAPDGSGPICMGYPRGHISEVYGPEASGKTTLALEAIAAVQKQGGSALFLDFEHALHHGYAQSLGVNFKSGLQIYQPDNLEQGLEMLHVAVLAGVDLIVVDSVAAMVPKKDMEKGFQEDDQIGSRARKLASLLPKIVKILQEPTKRNLKKTAVIFINQTRANISSTGGEENTSGGKALKFFAYLRLRATRIRSEYIKFKDPMTKKEVTAPYGNHTIVKIIKSKVDAKEGRTCYIFIRFGHGIDAHYSLIEAGVAHRLVQKGGAFYEFNGQRFQGREKLRKFLMENVEDYKQLEARVMEAIRTQDDIANMDNALDQTDDDEIFSKVLADRDDDDAEGGTEVEDVNVSPDDVDLSEVS